jgi:hypothetical protein
MPSSKNAIPIIIDHNIEQLTCPVHGDTVNVKRLVYPTGARCHYKVAYDGRLFSVRIFSGKVRLLKCTPHPITGRIVDMIRGEGLNSKLYRSRIVAMAWCPPPASQHHTDVDHADYNVRNNAANNLSFSTHSDNMLRNNEHYKDRAPEWKAKRAEAVREYFRNANA